MTVRRLLVGIDACADLFGNRFLQIVGLDLHYYALVAGANALDLDAASRFGLWC